MIMLSRREFMAYTVSSFLAASTAPKHSRESYERSLYNLAIKHTEFRPACVDVLYREFKSPNVLEAKYDNSNEFSYGNTDSLSFGTGKKSKIKLYPINFKHAKLEILGKSITIPPSIHILTTTMIHENRHADDCYFGHDLGSGILINRFNNDLFGPELRAFVWHASAYSAEILHTTQLKQLYNDAGMAHLCSSHYFYDFISYSLRKLREQKLTSLDGLALNAQLENLREIKDTVEETLSGATGKKVKLDLSF